jgi:membrane protein
MSVSVVAWRTFDWGHTARNLLREVKGDHLALGSAALAFYMVLALFPAAIFGLSLLPYLPIPDLEQTIMELVHQALPAEVAGLLTGTVTSIVRNRSGGLLSFGFLFAIWSASSGLHAVMLALDLVYEVEERRSLAKARGVALALTFAFFVLVVGALALVVFGGMLEAFIGRHLGWSGALRAAFALIRWVVIVGALDLGFAIVYWAGPNLQQPFALLTPGSVFATIAIILASIGFNVYVSHFSHYGAIYGSLGAVIALLVWLFITGWVILLGAEVNRLGLRSAQSTA